jgi:branched-chain amino acid aminotransferase
MIIFESLNFVLFATFVVRMSVFDVFTALANLAVGSCNGALVKVERSFRAAARRQIMAEKIVYLNGSFVAENEAKVSVLDSGFNAGDGVYDVTRTFAHKPFRLRDHTARLFRSLRYTRIDCGLSLEDMEKVTVEVFERNRPMLEKEEEVAIWQVVSRGMRSSRGNRTIGRATVAIYCISIAFEEFARHYVDGVKLVIPSTRRIPPQCLEPKAKINNKMNHNMAIFEAKQVDPHAIPLMLDLDGNISESNAHNFFLVVNGKLCTPSNKNVLDGVTKDALFRLASKLEIEVMEGNFTPYDAYNAEEAFLASTSPTIVPVQSINGVRPTQEVPGPVTKRLIQAWSDMVGVDIVLQALNHLAGEERERLLKQWRDKIAA